MLFFLFFYFALFYAKPLWRKTRTFGNGIEIANRHTGFGLDGWETQHGSQFRNPIFFSVLQNVADSSYFLFIFCEKRREFSKYLTVKRIKINKIRKIAHAVQCKRTGETFLNNNNKNKNGKY